MIYYQLLSDQECSSQFYVMEIVNIDGKDVKIIIERKVRKEMERYGIIVITLVK